MPQPPLNLNELRAALNELDHLRTFRDRLQAENTRVTEENRKLRESLASVQDLCLLFLGQHLWSASILNRAMAPCFCSVCKAARSAFERLTGFRPSIAQEEEGMRRFSKGVNL